MTGSDEFKSNFEAMVEYADTPDSSDYVRAPADEEQHAGTKPLITLPAQWWNWMMNAITKRLNSARDIISEILDAIPSVADVNNKLADKDFVSRSISSDTTPIKNDVSGIKELIPAQASPENQLADKDFVNSSVATNTANFIGNFDSLEALQSQTDVPVTNNDYAFVTSVDAAGNTIYKRYKYSSEDSEWKFEYDLNNTGFTAEQMAAINSGATKELIDRLSQMTADTLMPVATIITSLAETAPEGYLLCDGKIYATTQYPALYAAIGDKYNREGTSEGFFCVPDLRELVLVGAGQNTFHSIEAHDVFEVGEFKDDQFQTHKHSIILFSEAGGGGLYPGKGKAHASSSAYPVNAPLALDDDYPIRIGSNTRTKQLGVNYFIKAV